MDALEKIIKAQPEVDVKSEELEVKKMLDAVGSHKAHTIHFKLTKAYITEVEHVESSDDELIEQEHSVNEKKKHRGCFAGCFKKKKS